MIPPFQELRERAIAEVERTLKELPPELLAKAQDLAILYETAPSADLVAEGMEPDLLGLFVGPDYPHSAETSEAPHIVLFMESIWDQADGDEEIFLEEVRDTYLHELGHYLGLDEDDLDARGLG